MARKHSWKVYLRRFQIWQELGYVPWRRAGKAGRKKGGDFYRGAFDSIPFLNEDAKRSFVHLLLRPGYMMRDYIRGDHERYLSPLTSLIIFFSFFALVAALLKPLDEGKEKRRTFDRLKDMKVETSDSLAQENAQMIRNTLDLVRTGYLYLHLDQYPEEVDTRHETAIAALENTLRSQGFTLFLGKLFILWLAMALALRKFRYRMSAWAAVASYYLCQTSFFMLFTVILTFGESSSVGLLLMALLMVIDLRQLLGLSWRQSLRRSVAIGLDYVLIYGALLLLVSVVTVLAAYLSA